MRDVAEELRDLELDGIGQEDRTRTCQQRERRGGSSAEPDA